MQLYVYSHVERGAAAYAKAAMADPKVSAIYEKKAAKAHKSPWNMARSDYFKGKDLLAKK